MMLYQEAPHLRGFLLLLLKENMNLSLAISEADFWCRFGLMLLSIASLYIRELAGVTRGHQSNVRFWPEAVFGCLLAQ
jgi:hypothetical protein